MSEFNSLPVHEIVKHIKDAKILLQSIKDQGWDDINWAARS